METRLIPKTVIAGRISAIHLSARLDGEMGLHSPSIELPDGLAPAGALVLGRGPAG